MSEPKKVPRVPRVAKAEPGEPADVFAPHPSAAAGAAPVPTPVSAQPVPAKEIVPEKVETLSLPQNDLADVPAQVSAPNILTYTHSRQLLSEAKLNLMSKPEIRAVAADRGYQGLGLGGKRSLVRRFLQAQSNSYDRDLHVPGADLSPAEPPVAAMEILDETGV